MREILNDIEIWRSGNKKIALATVIKAYGSAPRPVGSKMAVTDSGDMAGSVSGGCVEGAVFEEAQDAIKNNKQKLLKFGISDDFAFSIGLACGGSIEVLVEPLMPDHLFTEVKQCFDMDHLAAMVTIITGEGAGQHLLIYPDGKTIGSLQDSELEKVIRAKAETIFHTQEPGCHHIEIASKKWEIYFDIYQPKPKLIIIGAVHIAIPLVTIAKAIGFATIVIDARAVFANRERFPHADQLVKEWPSEALQKMEINEGTFIVTLTHDEKLDNPSLEIAVKSKARYIGALGSKKTHAKRVQALKDAGLSDSQISRIHAPIGLNLGSKTPEEIALAIMAEIVAVHHGSPIIPNM